MRCPRCGSEQVFLQQVETGSVGMSRTTFSQTRHGLLYWLFIGWWLWIIKLCLWPLTLIFGRRKRSRTTASTVTGTRNLHRTAATCQQCGHAWYP